MVQHERRLGGDFGGGPGSLPGDESPARPDETLATPTATPAKQGGVGRAAREVVETLLLAVVIFLAVRLVVLNFRVDGHSMDPNLDDRQMLLVNRNAYAHFDLNGLLDLLPGEDRAEERAIYPFEPPERGDIVVFDPPEESEQPYIKRVIGLPGERITFRDDRVYVNGVALEEPYIPTESPTECVRDEECRVTVPPDHLYVLGDNRENSSDSRVFGPIDVDSVVGKAWLSYWPVNDVGLVPHYDYPEVPERAMRGEAVASPAVGTPTAATPAAASRPARTPGPDRTPRADRTPDPERASRADRSPNPERTPRAARTRESQPVG